MTTIKFVPSPTQPLRVMPPAASARAPSLVVVLGMHRAGTSAVTRALKVIGVELGDRLMPGREGENPTGFWEDLDFYALNQEMLRSVGRDWHWLEPLAAGDVDLLVKQGYLLRAIELLRSKTARCSTFGFKDPRVAKLLPFWRLAIQTCGLNVAYVIATRNPMSVARSLEKRNKLAPEKSYLLWLEHVLVSLSGTADAENVLVDYDSLLKSPRHELERLAAALHLRIDSVEFASYESEFLDPSLRHAAYDSKDLSLDVSCPPLVREVYEELVSVAETSGRIDHVLLQPKIDAWCKEFWRFAPSLRWADKLSERIEQLSHLESESAAMKAKLAENELQLGNLENALFDRYVQIDQFANELQRLSSLEDRLSKTESEAAALQAVLLSKDSQIANLRSTLFDCQLEVDNLSQALVQKVQVVKDREWELLNERQQLARGKEKLGTLEQMLREHEKKLSAMSQEVAMRDQKIDALTNALAEHEALNARLVETLIARNQELGALKTPWFFRLASPFRRKSR